MFVVLLTVAALSATVSVVQLQQSATNEVIQETDRFLDSLSERIEITKTRVNNGKLNLTLSNAGDTVAQVKSIYIVNETASPKEQYRYDVNYLVDGRADVTNIGQALPFIASDTNSYTVRVVTESGNSDSSVYYPFILMPVPLSLSIIPPVITTGENVSLFYTITNNLTSLEPLTVSPTISNSVVCENDQTCTATKILSAPNQVVIEKGSFVIVKETYRIDGPPATVVSFNASFAEAESGNYVIEEARVIVVVSTLNVAKDKAIAPDIYLIVPSTFGDSSQQGLWGTVVVNPTNSPMTVSRVLMSVFTAAHQGDIVINENCLNTPISTPSVANITQTIFASNTLAHNVAMPDTAEAGDLLLVLFTSDGNTAVTLPSGWTQVASNAQSSNVRGSVYAKVATGSEGGTTVNFQTSSSERAAAQVFRIPADSWYGDIGTGIAQVSTTSTGNSPNPPSLDPGSWGTEDTLWLAYWASGTSASINSYPSDYTNGLHTVAGSGSDGAAASSAQFVLRAQSENPGSFGLPANTNGVVYTIAIRPYPVDNQWDCPHANQIQWKDLQIPHILEPGDSRSFLVRVQPGQLGVTAEPGATVTATVYTDIGIFTKAGYTTSMRSFARPLANVYLTDTGDASASRGALNNAHMLGHMNNIAPGTNTTFYVTMADLDTNDQTYVEAGGRLIINVPSGFSNVGVSSWINFVNDPTVTVRADGVTQIIGITTGNTGDSGSGEAKVIAFHAITPSPTEDSTYIMYAFIDGVTNGSSTTRMSAGALAEIPLQVNGTG
jgi:hypothetical protein